MDLKTLEVLGISAEDLKEKIIQRAVDALLVKVGIGVLDKPMTRAQAQRYGEKNMPNDLRKAGFKALVSRSCAEIHGGNWFRISYGK